MRATLAAGALILAAVAGATAQHWDPYTRQVDNAPAVTICGARPAHPLAGVAYIDPSSPACR
jgi:hypothetical protein